VTGMLALCRFCGASARLRANALQAFRARL
jgi:hypothetical protein